VEGGDDADAAGGAGSGAATPPVMPSSTPSVSTSTSTHFKRARSGAWRDFSSMAMVLSVAGSTNLMLLGESCVI